MATVTTLGATDSMSWQKSVFDANTDGPDFAIHAGKDFSVQITFTGTGSVSLMRRVPGNALPDLVKTYTSSQGDVGKDALEGCRYFWRTNDFGTGVSCTIAQ
jgi:hypothetical protein